MTETAVRSVLDHEFPERPVADVRDCSGMAHATFAATLGEPEQSVVVTLLVRDHLAERFAAAPGLTSLARAETDVPIPAVVAADPTGEALGTPYFVTERRDGESPPNRFHGATDLPAAAVRDAGRQLARLHAATPRDAAGRYRYDGSGLSFEPTDWSAIVAELLEPRLDQLRAADGFALADVLPALRDAVPPALAAVEGGGEVTLCHGDFRPANCLFRDGSVTGVVDWELAVAGDPAYDLAKAEATFADAPARDEADREPLRAALRDGYRRERALPAGFAERREAYRLVHAVETVWAYPVWKDRIAEPERPSVEADLRALVRERVAAVE